MINRIYRQAAAEALGTAGLALTAFGSGHLARELGASTVEAAIIGTLAVAATLLAVLHAIGPLTGGHVNPAVSWSLFVTGHLSARDFAAFVASQCAGAAAGAAIASALWGQAIFSLGAGALDGRALLAEGIAALALVALIHGTAHSGNGNRLPVVVPAVVAAISFAAPFGVANPAISIAKAVVGGSWSVPTVLALVTIEIAAATLAAFAMRALYDGELTEGDGVEPTAPAELMMFEIRLADVQADRSEDVLRMAQKVVERSLRPTDFVVRGQEDRLLVFVEAIDEEGLAAMRRRLMESVQFALLAADLEDVAILRTDESPVAG